MMSGRENPSGGPKGSNRIAWIRLLLAAGLALLCPALGHEGFEFKMYEIFGIFKNLDEYSFGELLLILGFQGAFLVFYTVLIYGALTMLARLRSRLRN